MSDGGWQTSVPEIDWLRAAPRPPEGAPLETARMADALVGAGLVSELDRARTVGLPITLVANDSHRPTDTATFLSAFFSVVDSAIVSENGIKVRLLIASGTHRTTSQEREDHEAAITGRFRSRISEIQWNDCDDPNAQVELGGYGFHHWMDGAGLYLACGSTEPHYFAGVTGSHKTLTVGVMSRKSIEANHQCAMQTEARGFALTGNPVHAGILDALAALEGNGARLLALNLLMVFGRAVAAWSGHPIEALLAAVPSVRDCFGHVVNEPVDVVVARVAPPLDRDLYQADKGIKNVEVAVRDGGMLVVEAACPNGVGIDHFLDLLRAAPTSERSLALVRKRGYRLGDHKAVRLRALTDTRGVRVALISPHIDAALEAVLGIRVVPHRDAAVEWLQAQGVAAGTRGLLVDDAGNCTVERT